MKPIYIIGAGGAAKEIFLLLKEINASKRCFDFKGFIDKSEKESTLSIGKERFPVFAESVFVRDCKEKVSLAFALGNATGLKKVVDTYTTNPHFEFPNLIHPAVSVDESMKLGIGNIICAACIVTIDICIESFNYINRGVHIGHDCNIGSFNVINPCAVISGGVIMQDGNLIGTHATILQYLTIGSGNQVGAGAVLTKSIGNETCMTGVPATNKK